MRHQLRAFRSVTTSITLVTLLSGCLMNESSDLAEPAPPVNNGNNAPTISGTPPQVVKVGVQYSFAPQATDPDGDSLTFSIRNQPAWLGFDAATGSVSGIPMLGDDGTYTDIEITASDGEMSTSLPMFTITVEPSTAPNMPPEISGTPAPSVTVGNAYSFAPTASDPDGDPLTFTIQNLPAWASFNAQTGVLAGTPQAGDTGTYANIAISVSDNRVSSSLPAFSISVNAANAAPSISGTPAASVVAGSTYSFTPTASDPNGDTLTFSIDNMPAWAGFDSASGALSGTPQMTDVGNYTGIVIRASDGTFDSSLPAFSINVTTGNSAPQISGTPVTAVNVGQNYSFTPVATDADGDALSFTIQNGPGWAQFDSATGTLSGTPGAGIAGTYTNIVITVSDGSLSASLPAFSITVNQLAMGSATLTWTAPTQNTDGSPLVDLAGYRIRYGTSPGNYSSTESIDNPGITTYVINNLAPGTWYFVTSSVNSAGVESTNSNEASKTIN